MLPPPLSLVWGMLRASEIGWRSLTGSSSAGRGVEFAVFVSARDSAESRYLREYQNAWMDAQMDGCIDRWMDE